MCSPTALTGLGIQGASSIFATRSARIEAEKAQNANNKAVTESRAAAAESTRRALQDLDARELEDMLAAAQQQDQNTRAGNVLKSTATVAAGEAGVAGQSIDELLNDVNSLTGRNRTTIKANVEMTEAQNERSRDQILATGLSEYNSIQPKKFNKPSYLGAILGIATQGVQAYDSYADSQQRLKTPASTP